MAAVARVCSGVLSLPGGAAFEVRDAQTAAV